MRIQYVNQIGGLEIYIMFKVIMFKVIMFKVIMFKVLVIMFKVLDLVHLPNTVVVSVFG
jgi:hypothetical protein